MNGRSPLGDQGSSLGMETTPALVLRRVVNSADVQVQRSSELRQAQLNAGIGERDELAAIAERELKQMDVLGTETTLRLRQFELALRIFRFSDSQPDVIAPAFVNTHKFVPERLTTIRPAPEGSECLMAAILDDVFGQSSQVATAPQPTRPEPSAMTSRLCTGTPPSCGPRWGWIQPRLRVSLSCGAQ